MAGKLIAITDWRERARLAGYDPVELARSCGVSLRRLEQHFCRHYHCTPKHWLLRLKLAGAVPFLRQGMPIKQLATRVGFAHPPAFSRAFREAFGCSVKQILGRAGRSETGISFSGNEISLLGMSASKNGNEYSFTVGGSCDDGESNTQTQAYENTSGNLASSDRRHELSPAVRPANRRARPRRPDVGLGI
jgi:AraC-like DNA-binding protein